MADFWIKLYHEIIDDPKMATMPDRLWRRSIELMLLAGRYSKDKTGDLPETRQLAWAMRMSTDELQLDLDQLTLTGIIKRTPTGWNIVNFEKRQKAASDLERKQQERSRKQSQQYYEDVTGLSRNVTQSTENRLTEYREQRTDENIAEPEDIFDKTKRIIESLTGFPLSGDADIKSINKIIAMNPLEEDIKAGYEWYRDSTGKIVRYCSSLVGPIQTAMAKRIQKPKQKYAPPNKKTVPVMINNEVKLMEVEDES